MKTQEEIIEGLKALSDEANRAGMTFLGTVSFIDGSIAQSFCGEPVKVVYLAEVVKYFIVASNTKIPKD